MAGACSRREDDDDECIFGEGERNVDLSLRERERESRDLRHPVRYLYRSIMIISSSSSRHKPREKERRKKKEVVRYELGQEAKANWNKAVVINIPTSLFQS